MSGSAAGIVLIAEVDGVPVSTVGNPIATALAEGYRARTRDPRYLLPVSERAAR